MIKKNRSQRSMRMIKNTGRVEVRTSILPVTGLFFHHHVGVICLQNSLVDIEISREF